MVTKLESLLHGYIYHDGTVLDLRTNLIWQQVSPEKRYTWQQAKEYCASLSLAGYTDWRLPTKEELMSLINERYRPTICPAFQCELSWYWSSTSYAVNPGVAWLVYFYDGSVASGVRDNVFYVRAVRNRE